MFYRPNARARGDKPKGGSIIDLAPTARVVLLLMNAIIHRLLNFREFLSLPNFSPLS
jgi:hypothetical protein